MASFQIYSSCGLKRWKVVRLVQENNITTIYEVDPIKQVQFFLDNGFKWVHIVDLNAAFGKSDNKTVILKILEDI